jgi:phosphoglycerate kinase
VLEREYWQHRYFFNNFLKKLQYILEKFSKLLYNIKRWYNSKYSKEVLTMLNKKSVEDIQVAGKRVLVRCDFNVPLDENRNITDETRIDGALPTIKYLIDNGAKVILCSHMGKPKGEPKPELSLAPVAKSLSQKLGKEVVFAADANVVGENAKAAVAKMADGDVVLLENTRYRAEETKNVDAFSEELASLADIFVNDAFGTAHRAHCSNVGVTKYLDTAAAGYLIQKEISNLQLQYQDTL